MINNFGIKNTFEINKVFESEDFKIENNVITPLKPKTELYIKSFNDSELKINVLKNQQLTLLETINTEKKASKKIEINIEENASLSHFVLVENQNDLNHEISVNINKYGNYNQDICELGEGNTQGKFTINLNEQMAESKQLLIAIGKSNKNGVYEVRTNHNAPNTSGNMKNHGVCLDESNINIDGIGFIAKGNYKAASHQENKVMILGSKANAQTNPFLLIDEYDVDASHAASVGQINEDELYYLQSRGLPLEDAKKLVVKGFILPVTDHIKNDLIREMMIEKIDNLLK